MNYAHASCNCLVSQPEGHCNDDCEAQHKYENDRRVEAATECGCGHLWKCTWGSRAEREAQIAAEAATNDISR